MDIKLLVQPRTKLNARKAIKFIESQKDAKLAVVHSSIKNEVLFLDFFDILIRGLKLPFVGMRVSGTATNEGYAEDSVAIVIFCGDIDVKIFSERINYEESEKTASSAISKLTDNEEGLCLVYSANNCRKTTYVDAILRKMQAKFPSLQISGGVAAPQPIIVTKEGVFEDTIAFASIRNIPSFNFIADSGFKVKNSTGL